MLFAALLALIPLIHNAEELAEALPMTEAAIEAFSEQHICEFEEGLYQFLAIPDQERTFDNTIRAYDLVHAHLGQAGSCLTGILRIHPEKCVRDCADRELKKIHRVFNNALAAHPEIYSICLSVAEQCPQQSKESLYYLDFLFNDLKRKGMHLGEEERYAISRLQQEIDDLCTLFHRNISEFLPVLEVSEKELMGMSADWLSAKEKNKEGIYRLGCDRPTHTAVMSHCANRKTREKMHDLFANRAFPQNEEVICQLVQKRNDLARILGFSSYASYDLDVQMAKTSANVQEFLAEIEKKIAPLATCEFETVAAGLLKDIPLNAKGQWEVYDVPFALNSYLQSHFLIDVNQIAEYFPLDKVVFGLIQIFEQFFSLSIREVPHSLPIPELKALEVRDPEGNFLGISLIDLFPREGKYSHIANCTPFFRAYSPPGGPDYPAVNVVIGNFTRPTKDRPSLMTHSEVVYFFHEFGHAIHEILGRTEFLSLAGTNVKVDFVELPSQFLERWMWDPAILKQISCHYLTKEPLSDVQIDQMIQSNRFGQAMRAQVQCLLARLSLALFSENREKNPTQLMRDIWVMTRPHVALLENDHFHNAWIHIPNYGPKYYSYLWSNALVFDLFNKVREQGLLNPEAGKAYADAILRKGGSCDPSQLLRDYLGRDPSLEPFFNMFNP